MGVYKDMELSLMDWLKTIGALQKNSDSNITDINEVRNGTMLCRLAEIVSNRKLYGILNNPKSDANSLTNIKKSLDCFKNLPGIDMKQLCHEKDVIKGNRNSILRLLEELHRYYNESLRKPFTQFDGNYGNATISDCSILHKTSNRN